jgi:hypothetical protein
MEKNLIEINPTVVEQSVTYYGRIELDAVYTFRVKKVISDAGIEYEVDRVTKLDPDYPEEPEELKRDVQWLIEATIEKYCHKNALK